jgi:DNA replication protein DnaC
MDYEYLIIDDFKHVSSRIFSDFIMAIINYRSKHRRGTIVTSNLILEDLEEHKSDELQRLASRLKESDRWDYQLVKITKDLREVYGGKQ